MTLIRKRVLKINTNLKVKQMKTKRAKVIMLPTKDISQITLNTYINETHNCSNLQFNFKSITPFPIPFILIGNFSSNVI